MTPNARDKELAEETAREWMSAAEKHLDGGSPLGEVPKIADFIVSAITKQRDEFEAKLAEHKEDAERYRVLHNGDLPNYAVMSFSDGDDIWPTIDGDNLDRAIDAARRREEA